MDIAIWREAKKLIVLVKANNCHRYVLIKVSQNKRVQYQSLYPNVWTFLYVWHMYVSYFYMYVRVYVCARARTGGG